MLIDLQVKDRLTVLVDSLNAEIMAYGLLLDAKDSIIAEKSKQEVFYQDIIISKEAEIKITTKALKRNAASNKVFKILTVLGVGTTAALLIVK